MAYFFHRIFYLTKQKTRAFEHKRRYACDSDILPLRQNADRRGMNAASL